MNGNAKTTTVELDQYEIHTIWALLGESVEWWAERRCYGIEANHRALYEKFQAVLDAG